MLIVTIEVVTRPRTNPYRTCLICACVCELDPSRLTSAFLTRAPPPASIRCFQVLGAPKPPTTCTQHHTHSLQLPRSSHKSHPYNALPPHASKMSQPHNGPPSDSNTPTQERGLFSQEAQKHESHHYLRMYGGQVVNAAMMGFGMTLGADAANAVVGDAKVCMGGYV